MNNPLSYRIACMCITLLVSMSCDFESFDNPVLETSTSANKFTTEQALKLAAFFSDSFELSSHEDVNQHTKTSNPREISNIDILVQEGDTLLYVVNYEEDRGYIVLGADNRYFPMISHSSTGSFNIQEIENSGLQYYVEAYREYLSAQNSSVSQSSAHEWADFGKYGYEYEITPMNSAPSPDTKSGRTYSSGRSSIYPYTGIELSSWSQRGGYSYYADGGNKIGCPAIAIGMLMYDTSNRFSGNGQTTDPSFHYYNDAFNIADYSYGTPTALKLRSIADAIPGYQYGINSDGESGAGLSEIETGLHNLGYINATIQPYSFIGLYNNLSFVGYDIINGVTNYNRGVILFGSDYTGNLLHVWFCDGYYEQEFLVTKKFLGIKLKEWTEYYDALYMNWGHGPDGGNGWYRAEITSTNWTDKDGNDSSKPYAYTVSMTENLSNYVLPSHNQ